MTVSLFGRSARRALALLLLAGACGVSSAPAQAQFFAYGFSYGPARLHLPGPFFHGPRHGFGDYELDVVEDLRERGFTRIDVVERRRGVYVVDALTPRRQEVRLIVDAYDGEILQRFAYAPRDAAGRKGAALRDPAIKADPAKKEPPRRDLTGRDPLAREPARPSAQPASPPVAAAPLPPRRPSVINPTIAPANPAQQALPARRPSTWAPINSVPVAPLE